MATLYESDVGPLALTRLGDVGWQIACGPDLGPDGLAAGRQNRRGTVLVQRVWAAQGRLNPQLASEAARHTVYPPMVREGAFVASSLNSQSPSVMAYRLSLTSAALHAKFEHYERKYPYLVRVHDTRNPKLTAGEICVPTAAKLVAAP